MSLEGPEKVKAAHAWIAEHFENIRVFETDFAEVPDEVLMGVGRFEVGEPTPPVAPGASPAHPVAAFETWTYVNEAPLSLRRLEEVAAELPGAVFRCKGIVRSVEHPERPAALKVVGRRVEVSLLDAWRQAPGTGLVVIAAPGGIHPAELQELFDSARG